MIDLHCHILAGIDDGAATVEDSLAIARSAAAAGTRTMVATPHVSWNYPNDAEVISGLVAMLARTLASERIPVELLAGAELAMTQLSEIEPAQLERLGLGGGSCLLVEPPFTAVATGLDTIVRDLLRRGHRVLLAHTERCPAFQREPDVLRSLVGDGVLSSITAGSLVGRFGETVRRFALTLVDEQLVHNVASDAHNDGRRPPGLGAELERSGLEGLADWLAEDVPTAILADHEIPKRPAVAAIGAGGRAHRWRPWRPRG